MNKIILPSDYNYIGVFLTYKCTLGCDYCINHYGTLANVEELSTSAWIDGLSRLETRADLPITLQGGEPTLSPSFYELVEALSLQEKFLDLLTNGMFDLRDFCNRVSPSIFKREAKYASIRMSYHVKTNPMALAMKVFAMQNAGYDIGIWGIDHPNTEVQLLNAEMGELCKQLNIDFRIKEFLGVYDGKLYGTYKYKEACFGDRRDVYCKPSEFLINPSGQIFRCHADLYASRNSIGSILDKEITFPGFNKCDQYGTCNPCDIKTKFNRFQQDGHCAVQIKGKEVNE